MCDSNLANTCTNFMRLFDRRVYCEAIFIPINFIPSKLVGLDVGESAIVLVCQKDVQ